jgi:hypothetical protein
MSRGMMMMDGVEDEVVSRILEDETDLESMELRALKWILNLVTSPTNTRQPGNTRVRSKRSTLPTC